MSVPMNEPEGQTGGDVEMYEPEPQTGGDIDIYVPEKPQRGGLIIPPSRRGGFGLERQQAGGGIKSLGRRVMTVFKGFGGKALEKAGEKALEGRTAAAKKVALQVIAGKPLKDAVNEEKDNITTNIKRQAQKSLSGGVKTAKKRKPNPQKRKTQKKRKPRVKDRKSVV